MQKPEKLKDFGFSRQHQLKRNLHYAQQLKQKVKSLNATNSLMQPNDVGSLQPDDGETTYQVRQKEISNQVPLQTAAYGFQLDLDWGSYRIDFTRAGSHLLIGGYKGHVALLEWRSKKLIKEMNVEQRVRDVAFLNNQTLFAVAQKSQLYVYDRDGVQIHRLKGVNQPLRLEYLHYHFLLASLSKVGFLQYEDITTGQTVMNAKLKGMNYTSLAQNPATGVILTGDAGGRVSFFTPNSSQPAVKLMAHRGAVSSVAAHENYFVTAGNDGPVKLWDLRTFKQLHSWSRRPPADNLAFSGRGLLGMSLGNKVQVWKDYYLAQRMQKPYMRHCTGQSSQSDLHFIPYQDILGIGLTSGYESIIVPGSALPNYDYFEANPFENKKQRKEADVHRLLDKLPPTTITLSREAIGTVDRASKEILEMERKQEIEESKKKYLQKASQQQKAHLKQKDRKLAQGQRRNERLLAKWQLMKRGRDQVAELQQLHEEEGLDIVRVTKRKINKQ